MEKRIFYWYRNMLGRWSACIDSRFPEKGPEKQMKKLVFPAKELTGDDYNLTLDECMAKWPAEPPDEPQMVPADPPPPPAPQGQGESIFSMPMTEVEPEKAKT